MADSLIQVESLRKTYRQGFWMKRVEAVRGVSFRVAAGQSFGFLGPNGAGKTTTIKTLMGLIRPTSGEVKLFGRAAPARQTREKVGFMPENPYVYPYLTPREFVEMCGRLSGLRGAPLRDRAQQVMKQTGIAYAASRPVRRLSKGMLQRTGLAAALVADPELLVLDEPMSGLDPGGRKEVRDIIIHERDAGRTVFFSTHILADVPALCEHVCILQRGQVVVEGRISDLLQKEAKYIDVVLRDAPDQLIEACKAKNWFVESSESRTEVRVSSKDDVARLLKQGLEGGATVEEVVARYETLEELFVRKALEPQELPSVENRPTSASPSANPQGSARR